jgi:hypothetical protein
MKSDRLSRLLPMMVLTGVLKRAQCLALLMPVLLPAIHILVLDKFWSDFNINVNKEHCTCSCWDTVFKGKVISHGTIIEAITDVRIVIQDYFAFVSFVGPYEAGVAKYKHMYFNATYNTFKIWVITMVCAIILYECTKNIVSICFDRQLRYKMVLLFILSMFSHYYSWLVCY